MVLIYKPSGPAGQLANLCFYAAALVSDVLLIRLFLVLAYVWLLCSAALGIPKWPGMHPTGGMALDTVIWASVTLCFHAWSLFHLCWDERPISFGSEDEEQLWRFFYRRSGMRRLEMKQVLKHGAWLRVRAGQRITHNSDCHLRFYVLVEGLASLQNVYRGQLSEPRLQYSGCCWDLGLLSVFGIYTSFEKNAEHVLSATAVTDCLLYSWTADELAAMATRMAPAVGAFWRYFTLCQLGLYFGALSHPDQELVCATGEPELDHVLKGGRSRDFIDPLRGYEDQHATARGTWAWLRRSFSPFPPPGLRHNSLPITGIMARNRMIALKAAHAAAAIMRAESAGGHGADEAGEASEHGGRRAYEYLAAMQSLRRIDATSVEELLQDAAAHGISSREGSRHGNAGGASRGAAPVQQQQQQPPGGGGAAAAQQQQQQDGNGHGGGGHGSGGGSPLAQRLAGLAMHFGIASPRTEGSPRAGGRWHGRGAKGLGRLPTQPSMRRAAEQPPGDAV